MDLALSNRHVLITGGSKGIGLSCALQFLREGAKVSIVSRSKSNLEQAEARLRHEGFSCLTHAADVSDAAAALQVVDDTEKAGGPIDILVNSAGAAAQMPFEELTPAAWQDAFSAKFMTYMNVMDPLIKRMGSRGRGAIVNVVGFGGKVASVHHLAGGAANAALMLATAGLASAYGRWGVRVNAVNPASTLTERTAIGLEADARQRKITVEESLQQKNSKAALGRIATPEEVADTVVYLASSRASYINGAIVSMDGATVPIVV
jgi:NAD(P)-dependent dehydrogenase (short-subunit alcohol dehydrogenase family)